MRVRIGTVRACATLAVAALTACQGADAERVPIVARSESFQVRPPHVDEVAVQLIDPASSTARVFVRLARDPRLKDTLTVEGDHGPVELHAEKGPKSDASVLFTGTTTLDVDALRKRQELLDRMASEHGGELTIPVFAGRQQIGVKVLPKLPIGPLVSGEKVALDVGWVAPMLIDEKKSLFVRDTSVVGDTTRTYNPCTGGVGTKLGKWTFGYLMQQMAGTTDAAAMVRNWLAQWETAQTVNGLSIASRGLMKRAIIDPWPRTTPGGPLDLAEAPFRLLAIVNRIDLTENLSYGSGSAGELRFVFGALGAPPSCKPLQFTVIFEYGVERSGCIALRDWARAWADLSSLTPGTTAYNDALEVLTEQIVKSGAAPGNPNGSALAQLRTNEIDLLDLAAMPGNQLWELREFHLNDLGALAQSTVRRTPRPEANGTADVSSWVTANSTPILNDQPYDVPLQYPGTASFKGGDALMAEDTFWQGATSSPISPSELRHKFSFNTCSGCHARETDTHFTHVSPSGPLGQEALLSKFLTGTAPAGVDDPLGGPNRNFADLDRRRGILDGIANRSCIFLIPHVPPGMSH